MSDSATAIWVVHGCQAEAEPVLKNPMVGSFAGCCAPAASGHATAAPPMSDMNSRRFIMAPVLRRKVAHIGTAGDAAVRDFDPANERFGSNSVIRRSRLNVRFARKRTQSGRFMSTRPSSFLQPTTVLHARWSHPLFKTPKLESESYESGVPHHPFLRICQLGEPTR